MRNAEANSTDDKLFLEYNNKAAEVKKALEKA